MAAFGVGADELQASTAAAMPPISIFMRLAEAPVLARRLHGSRGLDRFAEGLHRYHSAGVK